MYTHSSNLAGAKAQEVKEIGLALVAQCPFSSLPNGFTARARLTKLLTSATIFIAAITSSPQKEHFRRGGICLTCCCFLWP